jgi:hypothetical protein
MKNAANRVRGRALIGYAAVSAAAALCPAQVKLQQTGAPFSSPIGVAYNPTNTSLIVTSNYPSGNPNSFSRIDQFGNTTPWSTASGLSGELYLDIPRAVNAPSGWTLGETFTGNGVPGQIMRISANGTTVTNTWTTLPGETGVPAGQMRFDNTGLFGNNLIVTTTSGNVWEVKANGVPIHLATLPGAADYEGLAVVPVDPTRYGPLSGKIVIGNESGNTLWTVDTAGNLATLPGVAPAQVEGLHIIPANEQFVGVDYTGGSILYADQSCFAPYVGDLMVVSEVIGANPGNPSGLSRLLWNGSGSGGFSIVPIPLTNDSVVPQLWEGSTFAPVVVPAPAATTVLALGVIAARRRRR